MINDIFVEESQSIEVGTPLKSPYNAQINICFISSSTFSYPSWCIKPPSFVRTSEMTPKRLAYERECDRIRHTKCLTKMTPKQLAIHREQRRNYQKQQRGMKFPRA
ncbi:hypothetical protein FRX31_013312 [Thalictrum thalictroides]|uniref:Uncharacterized protein n=1 Tax=Thalictrum thalictroides TaxID=46969 RepID=A0A7J6WIA1_THATH|nr:hypothetical protein FRX31_013312 [Thalictrum thalictroides]